MARRTLNGTVVGPSNRPRRSCHGRYRTDQRLRGAGIAGQSRVARAALLRLVWIQTDPAGGNPPARARGDIAQVRGNTAACRFSTRDTSAPTRRGPGATARGSRDRFIRGPRPRKRNRLRAARASGDRGPRSVASGDRRHRDRTQRPDRGRGGAAPGGARGAPAPAFEPLLREHRPRQHVERPERDPAVLRGADDHVRLVEGRALPRDPDLEHRDRVVPGDPLQARARPARRARRARGGGRARRSRTAAWPWTRWWRGISCGWPRVTRWSPTGRS